MSACTEINHTSVPLICFPSIYLGKSTTKEERNHYVGEGNEQASRKIP
uniref:Uncharacterized protein n=1 Tax=Arundo donax TaxID=35708 RepID=A0A0A9ADA7_ARUDO